VAAGHQQQLRQQVVQQWPQAAGSLGRLYAMGVDAYRLAPRLGQLKALPDNRVEGQSGSLGMNANQRVERQLPWAEFVGGQVNACRTPALMPDSIAYLQGKDAETQALEHLQGQGCACWRELAMQRRRA
jgi:hypothetical protein